MKAVEERYVHFACCLEWLNESWALLRALKAQRENPLFASSFRFALVLYAKPYRESRGIAVRKHRLDATFIPDQYVALHKEIVDERDQLHAHSDLTVMDALLAVHTFEEQKYAVMVRNHLDLTRLASRIDEVICLVEKTIDRMNVEVKALEKQLSIAGGIADRRTG